jgi:acyl carrier protein
LILSTQVEEQIEKLVQEELMGIIAITPSGSSLQDTPFADLGLRSIHTMSLNASLNSQFGLHIPVTSLYQHTTIHSLAKYVLSKLSGDVRHKVEEQLLVRNAQDDIAVVGIGCR